MSVSLSELDVQFDAAMMNIYQRALNECGYRAARFLQMLFDHRGIETARILLHASHVSDGYIALWERNRLDLTVEALILESTWRPLFSDRELKIARKRLADYGYNAS